MKKSKSSLETLKAVRRNTAYTQSRTLSLVYCVLLVGVIGLLVFAATNEQPFNHRLAWLFAGILAGVAASACLYHYLVARTTNPSLLQVAKFQERSIRTRNDAVALVEKIREEVSEEEEAAAGPENAEQASAEETSEPVPEKETTPESEKES